MIKRIFFLITIYLFASCNNNKNEIKIIVDCFGNTDTVKVIRKFNSQNILIERKELLKGKLYGEFNEYYEDISNSQIKEMKTFLNGDLFGDNIEYFRNNIIKDYEFRIDSFHQSFHRTYNIIGNNTLNEGSPLAYKLIGISKTRDTLDIKFVFVDKIFSNLNVEFSIDGLNYNKVIFAKCDYEFPFNKVYRYTEKMLNINTKEIIIYFKISCTDKQSNEKLKYYDTTYISKNKLAKIK